MSLTLCYVNEMIACFKSDLGAELLVDQLPLVLVSRGPTLLKSLLYLYQGCFNLVQCCEDWTGGGALGIEAHHNLTVILVKKFSASCRTYLIISDFDHIIYLFALQSHLIFSLRFAIDSPLAIYFKSFLLGILIVILEIRSGARQGHLGI